MTSGRGASGGARPAGGRRLAARMEERERLRRQIRLLQGLINDHKNVHGNAPVPPPASTSRWRNPKHLAFHSQAAFSARYSQQPARDFLPCQSSANAWRNKYSLINVPARPALSSTNSISVSSPQTAQNHTKSEASEPQLMLSKGSGTSFEGSDVGMQRSSMVDDAPEPGFQQGLSGATEGTSASRGYVRTTAWPLSVGSNESQDGWTSKLHCKRIARGGNSAPVRSQKRPVAAKAAQGVAEPTPGLCRTISESAVTLKSEPQQPLTLPEHGTGHLTVPKNLASHIPALQSSLHSPGGNDKLSPTRVHDLSAGWAHSTWEEATSGTGTNVSGNKPSALSVQKQPPLLATAKPSRFKRTNYTWVANPSKSPRSVRRWAVSRASENIHKFALCAETAHKLQSKGELGAKPKKSGLHSKLGISSSQYKWNAASPSTSASVFTWQRKECAGPGDPSRVAASTSLQASRRVPLGHGTLRQISGNIGFLNYKLRSRTKIIKRKGSICSPTGFSSLLLKSRYCLRKRNSTRGRPSAAARRAGTKGLVQIGKHRLRRLPASRTPGWAKEGSSRLLVTSPATSRVVNTRYRLVKKTVASSLTSTASVGSLPHTWKARRLSASRSLVLNCACHSSLGSKSQAVQPRWRNKGLRCIGGVMYRVSANKLAKTSSSPARSMEVATRSHARAARLDSAHGIPGYSPSTSRYIASRAVQKSLAIIRQAKQRKERRKEYCMYYNRFGKCNRGESCPFIHDPEKVAVCTRFLRGTCKKTDGTCPFAHKVSKDKMPVCSYFLKGICSNSDCPYSHVYVSRKAEVCSDFLKGYCPLGEKCKKKHTLVCPDFSKHGVCPRGSQCRLQHPRRKRLARHSSPGPSVLPEHLAPKRGDWSSHRLRRKEEEGPGPSGAEQAEAPWHPKGPAPAGRLTKQPSFISLQSPPTSPSEEAEGRKPARSGEEAAKPLQIKPRL